jgi:hypothetical protein
MTLDECKNHIGAGVVYEPWLGGPKEDGEIVSVKGEYVHVRYKDGIKATYPQDLTLLAEVFLS